jgi:hypothetical protein
MFLKTAPTPSEALLLYRNDFAGASRPILFPGHFYGFFILFAYLLIPHTKRPWVYAARWPVLAIILAFQVRALLDSRHMGLGAGIMVGMSAIYGAGLASTWLCWNRPQFDAKQIQMRVIHKEKNSTGLVGAKGESSGIDLGIETTKGAGRPAISGEDVREGSPRNEGPEEKELDTEYYWQSYPEDFLERISWVSSLILSRRGSRWNWRISTLPDLPEPVASSLYPGTKSTAAPQSGIPPEAIIQSTKSRTSFTGVRTFSTLEEMLREQTPRLLACVIVLLTVISIMKADPYFCQYYFCSLHCYFSMK